MDSMLLEGDGVSAEVRAIHRGAQLNIAGLCADGELGTWSGVAGALVGTIVSGRADRLRRLEPNGLLNHKRHGVASAG
jgi:hypothetical protein